MSLAILLIMRLCSKTYLLVSHVGGDIVKYVILMPAMSLAALQDLCSVSETKSSNVYVQH